MGYAADPTVGVICLLAVMPTHRRQGIGSELLEREEEYLRKQGEAQFAVKESELVDAVRKLLARNNVTWG